jgi:hypothetical protein
MHLFRITMRLAGAVRNVTGCEDLNIVVNSGVAAGQDEPHYHVHIIPRRDGDGFDIPLPFGGSQMPDRTLLDAMAVQINADLRDPMRTDGDEHRGGSDDEPAPAPRRTLERTGAVPLFADAPVAVHAADSGPRTAMPRQPDVPNEFEGAHGELRWGEE